MSKSTGRVEKPRALAFCQLESCRQAIDPKKLVKSPHRKFCCQEHHIEWRKQHGLYAAMGALGNESQANVKRETGKIPHYEKRAQAVSLNNRTNPPRRKKPVE